MKCKFSVDGEVAFCSLAPGQPFCDGEEKDRKSCPFWRIGRDSYGQKQ